MKKAEEYIRDFWGTIQDGHNSRCENISEYDVLTVIRTAQQEAFICGFDEAKANPDIDYMKLKFEQ